MNRRSKAATLALDSQVCGRPFFRWRSAHGLRRRFSPMRWRQSTARAALQLLTMLAANFLLALPLRAGEDSSFVFANGFEASSSGLIDAGALLPFDSRQDTARWL